MAPSLLRHGMTFGETIRARRLGYYPLADVGLMRIGAAGPPWRIDVRPFGLVPVRRGSDEDSGYRIWWEGDTQVVEETLRRHLASPVTTHRTLWLNDEGNQVAQF